RFGLRFVTDQPLAARRFERVGEWGVILFLRCPGLVLMYAASNSSLVMPTYPLAEPTKALFQYASVALGIAIITQLALPLCGAAIFAIFGYIVVAYDWKLAVDVLPVLSVAIVYVTAELSDRDRRRPHQAVLLRHRSAAEDRLLARGLRAQRSVERVPRDGGSVQPGMVAAAGLRLHEVDGGRLRLAGDPAPLSDRGLLPARLFEPAVERAGWRAPGGRRPEMVAVALGTGDGHRAVLAADLPAPLRADPDPAAVPASVDHHQGQPPHRDQRPAQLTRARVLSGEHRA